MHFFAPIKTFGGHGIVGGQTPLGLGIAYALKFNKKPVHVFVSWAMERPIGDLFTNP